MKYVKIYEDFNKIEDICKFYKINNYKIDKNGTIDVTGSIFLSSRLSNLTKLPLKFGKVDGDFYCDDNNLRTLEGCPYFVGGDFSCSLNRKLSSFIGCPETIDGFFFSNYTNIRTFEGFPINVTDFNCFSSPIFEIFTLFYDTSKIELFNEYDIIRGDSVIIDRLNDFLVTIGKDPVESVDGYNNIS